MRTPYARARANHARPRPYARAPYARHTHRSRYGITALLHPPRAPYRPVTSAPAHLDGPPTSTSTASRRPAGTLDGRQRRRRAPADAPKLPPRRPARPPGHGQRAHLDGHAATSTAARRSPRIQLCHANQCQPSTTSAPADDHPRTSTAAPCDSRTPNVRTSGTTNQASAARNARLSAPRRPEKRTDGR